MTKFPNKLKKPCFWSILDPFFPILGQKKLSQKIRLCHAQLHMSFQHHAKFQKKLRIQFQENAWTEGRTEGQKNGQTLFYRTLPATAGGPIKDFSQRDSFLTKRLPIQIYETAKKLRKARVEKILCTIVGCTRRALNIFFRSMKYHARKQSLCQRNFWKSHFQSTTT